MSGAFDLGVLAYPWDVLEDRRALDELAASGCTSISVAAAYHSLRQLRPRSTGALVREEPHAAVHWRADPASFRGSALGPVYAVRPTVERALRIIEPLPIRRYAWISVLHSSALARRHPSSALRISTGDRLRHALCPSRPEVLEYGRRLVGDAVRNLDVDGVELEATGFHGWSHGSRHDKATTPVDRVRNFLLSVCFCEGCCGAIREVGGDPEHCRSRFERGVRVALRDEDAGAQLEELVPDEVLVAVLEARARVVVRFTEAMLEAAGETPVLIHAGPDPYATGSRASLAGSALDRFPRPPLGVVVSTDGMSEAMADDVARSAVAEYGARAWISVRVQRPDIVSGDALGSRLDRIRDAGAQGVRLHNLGLWDQAQLTWVRASAEARKG